MIYVTDPYACGCARCESEAEPHQQRQRMIVCETCGNKRCPHATDHRNSCTGSNEPGQPGSLYPKFIASVLLLAIIACTPKKAPEPVVVKIPVPVECPKVVMPPRPNLPVIQDGDDVATIAKKLAVGNALLVQYIRQLEVLIAPFTTPGATNVPAGLPPQPGQRQAANAGGRSGEDSIDSGRDREID